jgi:SAM-dependent MidA family methyltransferase
MTPAGEILADEIRRQGPVPFRRFMEVALYHPQCGYYRKKRDPFGKEGDFFTAEQLQPVFGILMAARVRQLYRAMGEPGDFTVVEPGAGRGEMAEAFSEWRYLPVEASQKLPEHFQGVVFSNEFFDALPVEVAICRAGEFREQRVGFSDGRFFWQAGEALRPEAVEYLQRYAQPPEEDRWYEINLDALRWMERFSASLARGWVISVDYGYTRAEAIRFPQGTLMGYRRHTAREDVLSDPGERDITAHVNFTALEAHGERCDLRRESFETLAKTILTVGEADQFAAALAAADESDSMRRRMQLKTLLFGMGETFRVLTQSKTGMGKSE